MKIAVYKGLSFTCWAVALVSMFDVVYTPAVLMATLMSVLSVIVLLKNTKHEINREQLRGGFKSALINFHGVAKKACNWLVDNNSIYYINRFMRYMGYAVVVLSAASVLSKPIILALLVLTFAGYVTLLVARDFVKLKCDKALGVSLKALLCLFMSSFLYGEGLFNILLVSMYASFVLVVVDVVIGNIVPGLDGPANDRSLTETPMPVCKASKDSA
ncbi:MAG: hypothetical protein ACI9TY_001651 [Alphaproteobacteria bacterium]|jgi:hypothetical protein